MQVVACTDEADMDTQNSRMPAEELSNMVGGYSKDAYKGDWTPCIKMLRVKFDLTDREIEAVLRSKWTRWAGDMSANAYGRYSAADLKRFMDKQTDLRRDIAQLVKETFGS